MQFIRTISSACLIVLIAASVAVAQGGQMMQPPQPANPDSVTDAELQKFANVSDSAQSMQQQIQSKVQDLVEAEGMEFARFRKIMMSKQNPQAPGNIETSQEEEQTIKKIQPKLMEINKNAQQQFVQLIRDQGLTPQRFRQLMRGVQTNQQLKQRLQEIQGGSQ